MKDKIMYLVIGALVGAIITAGCFMIFNKNNSNSTQGGFDKSQMQMDGNMMGGPGGDGNMTKPEGNPPADINSNSTTSTDSTNSSNT